MDLRGLKIIAATEMARVESLAYLAGAKERDFMESAGKNIAATVASFISSKKLEKRVTILGGKGNNGGDAYVAGRYLLKEGFSVRAFHLFSMQESSSLCKYNLDLFIKETGQVDFVRSKEDITFGKEGIILDGLLGTGFKGRLEEPLLSVVEEANGSHLPILSIDVPSGVDGNSGKVITSAIKATLTIFLQLPKSGFFLNQGWNYIGELKKVNFGLPEKFIEQADPDFYLLDEGKIIQILPPIVPNRHKYQAGFVVGIGGCWGMGGAAKLSSLAALRSGCGIVKLLVPEDIQEEMASAPYEVVKLKWEVSRSSSVVDICNKAKALFIGPGMGRGKEVEKLLLKVLSQIVVPTVLDADSLYFLSEHLECKLPKDLIMTPHRQEMLRLLSQENEKEEDFLDRCQNFCERYSTTLVLKGAPTIIFYPKEVPMIIPRGDPGMATAGSGDVLTGMIAALLAQGVPTYQAAILGVYLQGISGEITAKEKTSYSLIASDLIENLPLAFKYVLGG